MTISYHIDQEKELVEVVFNGLFTVVQLIRLARDIIDDPSFDPQFDILADCATARIGRVTFDLADAMMAISVGNQGRRLAIVMPKGDGAQHAVRFVELRRDHRRARTFASRSLAEAWLAAPPPEDDA
jgi:hypothetical protein